MSTINSYTVVFSLALQTGEVIATDVVRHITPTKSICDERSAAVNVAYLAKMLNLVATIQSTESSSDAPDKLRPVSVNVKSAAQKAADQAIIDAAVADALAKQAAALKSTRRVRVVKK